MTDQYKAEILADSISPNEVRLTTMEVTLPRIVLAEFNTHRTFCLAGDTKLEFDLPAGAYNKGKRVYRMRLDEFVDKWTAGARRMVAKQKKQSDLSVFQPDVFYSPTQIAELLDLSKANINGYCRTGVLAARRASNGRTWLVYGAEVKRWRATKSEHTRYNMRARLSNMRIRQFNEDTGDVQFSYVKNACISGEKEVFEVRAGKFLVAGSADHRVLTAVGWKTISEISVGDFIVVRKFGKKDGDKLDPMRLKNINGRWRSVWQREHKERLLAQDATCRQCHQRAGIEIHHITPVYRDPSRAFDVSNITLLCNDCHDAEHAKQDWQGGTYLYGAFAAVTGVVSRGIELTYDLEIAGDYPNFLANGVVVHNSRNSASSRAIPIEKRIEAVRRDPFVPETFGKNQKGMQAEEDLDQPLSDEARVIWALAATDELKHAAALAKLGVHKQLVNRRLEADSWHTLITTATEWDNFFALRCNSMAQPEIRRAAELMREAIMSSAPRKLSCGEWHLPLCPEISGQYPTKKEDIEHWCKVSAARCARVSYLTHDGKRDIQADIDLYTRLATSGHLSPLEHIARPMSTEEWQYLWRPAPPWNGPPWIDPGPFLGNLRGWVSARKLIPNEDNILAP